MAVSGKRPLSEHDVAELDYALLGMLRSVLESGRMTLDEAKEIPGFRQVIGKFGIVKL